MHPITIAIPTYKRPNELKRLLLSLAELESPVGATIDIIVMDNDADQSGEAVFNEVQALLPFPARYYVESKRGVTHVRNSLLQRAHGEFIAFVDDDEYVERQWLKSLYDTATTYKCDAVMGRVIPKAPAGTPNWLVSYLETGNIPPSGQSIDAGTTSSALIRLSLVRANNLLFDERFNLTGGEDSDFFERFKSFGATIHFSRESIAVEPIHPARLKLRWFVIRNFRVGQTNSILLRRKKGFASRLVSSLVKGAAGPCLVLAGSLLSVCSRERGMRLAMTGVRCLGHFSAALGVHTNEYGG